MRRPSVYVLAGVLVLAAFLWLYLPALSRYRDLKNSEENIKREIQALNVKISELEEERDLLKNDLGYIEKVIREELGLVKSDEIVYKFIEKEEEQTELPPVGIPPQ